MEAANAELLRQGLRGFGLDCDEASIAAIVRHLKLVAEWNERVNLTAVTAEREMVLKHALDSASLLSVVPLEPGSRVLDVGTGAGFPGITLKCLVPGIDLVLLESLAKRCRFLEAAAAELLPVLGNPMGLRVVWGRAEDVGQQEEFREKFDVVVARAVAELRVLSEYCLPFCRLGGEFVAMKGPSVREELGAARRAIEILGGEVVEVREIELPEGAGSRSLVRIRKGKKTPKTYPRKAGVPAKRPL